MNPTALIVIDMQNAFLHSDGENFYPEATQVIAPVRALVDKARDSHCLVVHTLDRHRVGLPDFEQRRLPVHGLEGGFDAAYFDGFGPKRGRDLEVEIVKRRYSAFFSTDLALLLRECGIENTLICGVKTNVCVRATAQDAFAHGFHVRVVREATNSNRANLAAASLEDIDRYLGKAINLDAATQLLGAGAA
tara:strand:+ start:112735 stop:113307 length:573 start_codon:yes stop_codon:yes gene_type:complete